jgi:hypothetical protein
MADRVTMADRSRVTNVPVALGIGLIVALKLAVGTAAQRRRRREPPTRAEKRAALIAYLHEHLSGADLALHVVERLRRAQTTTGERQFYKWLYEQIDADPEVINDESGSWDASVLGDAQRVAVRVSEPRHAGAPG